MTAKRSQGDMLEDPTIWSAEALQQCFDLTIGYDVASAQTRITLQGVIQLTHVSIKSLQLSVYVARQNVKSSGVYVSLFQRGIL